MTATGLPLSTTKDGVVVTVRVTPRSSREGIAGLIEVTESARPATALAVRVSAPPVDGAANQAVVRVLSRAWRLPASAFAVVSGETGRVKRILVRGEPQSLLRALSGKLAA